MWEGLAARLEGELVVLEPLGREHEDSLRAAASDPEIWRWTTAPAHEPASFARWLDAALAAAQLLVRERGLAIELPEAPPFSAAPLDVSARSRVVAAATPELCVDLFRRLTASR